MKHIRDRIRTCIDRLPDHEKRITFSTLLTITRLLLIPLIMDSIQTREWNTAMFLLSVAGITDLLDGALARLWDEQTLLGACLDPLADKLLVIGCFMSFSCSSGISLSIPPWCTTLIIVKEMVQLTGALFLYSICGSIYAHPTLLGKATTTIQITFMLWISACNYFHWAPLKLYGIFLALMVVGIVGSLAHYTYIGAQLLMGTMKNNIR